MNPNFSFVLVDLTTATTPAAMRPAQAFNQIIQALYEQSIHYGLAWGMPSVAFQIATPATRQAGDIAINFRDLIPEAPGDLAYHQIVDGVPDIEIGVDLFSNLIDDVSSMSVGVSHEVLETMPDPGTNQWASIKDSGGMMRSKEICDPVENTFYKSSNGVALQNFVFPNYFMSGTVGPFDHMGVLPDVTNASIQKFGYEIQAPAPGSTVQVGGKTGFTVVGGHFENAMWVKRKGHAFSRGARRYAGMP